MSKSLSMVLTLASVLGLTGTAAWGVVGVNDPCPWPTPYPPPGAGWAAVYNPNFESGFTGGVANQWTGWKDSGLPGQVHYDGTDRKYEGSHSQKLIMPTPTGDMQEAGIYQRIYVVPGETYTATVKVYLQIDNPDGWDLLAFLGLDPYGSDTGDSSSTAWYEVSTYGQWRTATVTVDAVLPVMTVSLKGTRKWPRYRDTKIWFDQVTFTGPVPTEPPPGPGDEPVDPETLIPATIGPNLVANPSFEDAYTGGVSAGWNAWSTLGSGQWKRSQRVGKIGGGKYDCYGEQDNIDMRPKTVLLYGNTPPINDPNDPGGFGVYGTVESFSQYPHMDNTIIVGRPAIDDNMSTYLSNPVFYGHQLADQLKLVEHAWPRIDCWQGLNEPDWDYNWQKVLSFEKSFAERAHQLGMKTVALNLSTGSPGNVWQMVNESYDPHCGDLLAVADYLGHHVYGGPGDDFMVTSQVHHDPCDFALRPRRFKDMYDRREWRFPPVIATEGSTWGAWHGAFTPDRVLEDIIAMGGYMNANRWWCGYTNFVVGAWCSWQGFDLVFQMTSQGISMAQAIGNWNYDHPCDAMDAYYAQMFGAGEVHPKTLAELTPAGTFNGGINRQVANLIPGEAYLLKCWMKYEFRGQQPTQLRFYLGVDPTGQTSNPNAATINWGDEQIGSKAPVHEIFSHLYRTYTATGTTASVWLRAYHPTSDPSFKCYLDLVEVKQLDDAPPGPYIEVGPTHVQADVAFGGSPPNGSFTIRNIGIGTINYTFQESCDWLSLAPPTGSSSGETDTITIVYDTDQLAPGTHDCQVTVIAPGVHNSPLAAPVVTVNISTVAADFDADGDVDLSDFGHLQACLTGEGITPPPPGCDDADLNGDLDVDQDDFALFQACLGGAGQPPAPTCGG